MAENNNPTVMTAASTSKPQTVDLTKKVKLYAPKKAKHHDEGEETLVHPLQVAHFKKLGYTDQTPAKEEKAPADDKK